MPIASDLPALKQRLDSYFWRNRSPEMKRLKDVLSNHFLRFEHVAVVGGLVRDFAREGRNGFRSDVDLVVDAPAHEVAMVAKSLDAKANRFGGFGTKIGIWKIDFWSLETTWAARHAGVQVSHLEDITRCTFFDWDAIAYDLHTRSLLCDAGYLDRLRGGTLDINLCLTPSVEGNLLRAMRRLVLWRLRPGPILREFIENRLDRSVFANIQSKEAELYSSTVSTMWEDVDSAKRTLLDREDGQEQLDLELPNVAAATKVSSLNASIRKAERQKRSNVPEVRRLPGV